MEKFIFSSSHGRKLLVIFANLLLVALANFLAFILRFEGAIPQPLLLVFFKTLPWLLAIRIFTFIPFHLYEGLWRYTSVVDLLNIVGGVIISSLIFFLLVYSGLQFGTYPTSVMVVDAMLIIFLLGAIRLGRRLFYEYESPKPGKRVLIFGAGDAGEMIVRDMRNNPSYHYQPIGFVDDDSSKLGFSIHGVKVLGSREDLPKIVAQKKPDEVLLAVPSAEPAHIRGIVQSLSHYKVPIRALPNLCDILDGRVTVNQIRNLSMEDLLPRKAHHLDATSVRQYLFGKRILVTGAGGSIGSELCRQILLYQPSQLVLFDHAENNLFHLLNKLLPSTSVPVIGVVGSVTDSIRLREVFSRYVPEIVFHAAAHKHVPLMELNPFEAIKNNVFGTWRVMSETIRVSAESFVLISTDKAVKPASFMGATKALAELLVKAMSEESPTRLLGVRFGNVLGSEGSAIPLFSEQIRKGGPVTITHPDVKRYFMLISEAVQLVLQAASLGRRGDLLALEMGELIPVIEMAKTLIRLSGFRPEEDIEIKMIGLRPGEKLAEELFDPSLERVEKTSNPEVVRLVTDRKVSKEEMLQWLEDFEMCLTSPDVLTSTAAAKIQEILPTFSPLLSTKQSIVEHNARF